MDSPDKILQHWGARLIGDQKLKSKILGVIGFEIDGHRTLLSARGEAGVVEGNVDPDCTLILSGETLTGIASGTLNPQKAYLEGKIKVTGKRSYALRLIRLIEKR